MMEPTRRRVRSSRTLSAVLAAVVLACTTNSASAFVSHSSVSLPPRSSSSAAPPAAASQTAGRPRQQQPDQTQRRLQHSRDPRGNARRSRPSSALAGALPAEGAVPQDPTDGWEPIDGVEVGTCSLVGSGPGDPDLLTVAGLRELQSADLVIADRLVSKEILGLVSVCLSRVLVFVSCFLRPSFWGTSRVGNCASGSSAT